MTSDPAERLTVKATQVGEPHAADCQHRLAVTTADFKTSILALKTQTHPHTILSFAGIITVAVTAHTLTSINDQRRSEIPAVRYIYGVLGDKELEFTSL